jgi:hypothetical protein
VDSDGASEMFTEGIQWVTVNGFSGAKLSTVG